MSKRKVIFYFEDFIREKGFTFEFVSADGTFYASSDLLRVRCMIHLNEVHWGVKECFDRWANSRDFCSHIPKTKISAEKLYKKILAKVEVEDYDPGWAREEKI